VSASTEKTLPPELAVFSVTAETAVVVRSKRTFPLASSIGTLPSLPFLSTKSLLGPEVICPYLVKPCAVRLTVIAIHSETKSKCFIAF
jgi:hypothetical protein